MEMIVLILLDKEKQEIARIDNLPFLSHEIDIFSGQSEFLRKHNERVRNKNKKNITNQAAISNELAALRLPFYINHQPFSIRPISDLIIGISLHGSSGDPRPHNS